MPDSRLDIGAMRGGDVEFDSTEVDLKLNLIKPELVNGKKRRRLRDGEELSLLEMIQESVLEGLHHGGRDLQSQMVKIEDGGYSYELKEEDKTAIGKVTSEVSRPWRLSKPRASNPFVVRIVMIAHLSTSCCIHTLLHSTGPCIQSRSCSAEKRCGT